MQRNFVPREVLGEGEIDWQEPLKFGCWLVQMIFSFLLSLFNFHKTSENQILIPDWTYFHCSGTTLLCLAPLGPKYQSLKVQYWKISEGIGIKQEVTK